MKTRQKRKSGWPYVPGAPWIDIAAIICLSSVTLWGQFTAASQQSDLGLLPPAGAGRSATVAQIRDAFQAGDLGSAKEMAVRLVESELENYEGYFWAGFLELQLGQPHEAIRLLRRAESVESNTSVLKALAVSYYAAHQYRLFLQKMNEAREADPDDFAPYYYLGRYYNSQLASFEKAAEYFQQAIARNPQHFRSHYYLGHSWESIRRLPEAEQAYRGAIGAAAEAGAEFGLGQQGMARLRLLEGRAGEALPFATRAVTVLPQEPESHRVLARVYQALSRPADAVERWLRAATLDPTDATTQYQLYRAYAALGQEEKARAALREFNKLTALYER